MVFFNFQISTKVCKLLHNKRPGVWRGQEDYLYIHKVLFYIHKILFYIHKVLFYIHKVLSP